jgi:phosphotransferase system  glucose/maltose/N-acetylglucosamine-specific IIC component
MNYSGRLPDFDTLVALHRESPEAFERLRRKLLLEAVEAAPIQHRPTLENVLVRIEAARDTAATPMEAAVIASRMMHESVVSLATAWKQAQSRLAGLQTAMLIDRCRYGI